MWRTDRAVRTRYARDFRGQRDRFRLGFQAHAADSFVGRADKLEVAVTTDLGEVWILAEESVAGVDRLHVSHFGCGDDPGNVEIRVGTRGLADADRAIGEFEVRGVAVGLGVDDDDFDA